jgi:hypothetical protein
MGFELKMIYFQQVLYHLNYTLNPFYFGLF